MKQTYLSQLIDIQGELTSRSKAVQLDLGTIIESFAGTALVLAGVATFAFMLWGGLDWILAGGEKGKIEEARKKITQGIIGLIVTASSFALFRIIQFYIGINVVQ